jgi:flagellin-like hook-associated protein FlgL
MLSMISRVGTFAQRSSLVQQMNTLQQRMYETQTQLVTEKKSQDYTGVASASFRLVNVETELSGVQRFRQTNVIAETRLSVMNTAVTDITDSLHAMRDQINSLDVLSIKNNTLNEDELDKLESLQQFAFGRLQDISYLLNSKGDDDYLFSGGRTDKASVKLPFGSLKEFQDFYDGTTITYPGSRINDILPSASQARGAHVANVELKPSEYTPPLVAGGGPPPATPYTLTINPVTAFNNIPAGSTIRLTDGNGVTDVYTVLSNAGAGTLELSDGQNGKDPTADFDLASVTVETITYYGGDDLELEHRISDQRTLQLGINAKDPAFEKAIRALGILAQGSLTHDVTANLGTLTFQEDTLAPVNLTDPVTLGNLDPPGLVVADITGGWVQSDQLNAFDDIQVGETVSFSSDRSSFENGNKAFKVVGKDNDGVGVSRLYFEAVPDHDVVDIAGAGTTETLDTTTGAQVFTKAFKPDRIRDALTLLNDAINHASGSSEMSSDIVEVSQRIGYMQITVDKALEDSLAYETFLENRIGAIENVNTTEAATRLQDDIRALEISYQSYARISQLSLQNYLAL